MTNLKVIASAAALTIVVGAGLYLKTPSPTNFDRSAAIEAAKAYDARIIRDAFGVPHIYGARDADVGFGLAYAHAEDDWATIEEVIFFSRGAFAQRKGKEAAIPDYLIGALRIADDVHAKYENDLTQQTRALVEGYAAGINLWCAEQRGRCAPGAAPVSAEDVIAGFVSRTPFFYGLDRQLTEIFEGDVDLTEDAEAAREAFLRIDKNGELGSNAMAVAPSRAADGHTRLMVNSHQPYSGPIAWYEARLKSEEGWDMIGGLFPGAPLVLVGASPNLGWAHTVNRPDLVDAYALTVDDPKKPTQYKLDGEWQDFDVDKVKFRVKLFGPFSLPVTREAMRSVHGPVFVTEQGVFAVSYANAGDIRTAEQWFRMNKAQNFAEFRSAMDMSAIPSFNTIYADKAGNIAYYYNAAIPIRDPGYDWSKAVPGDRSETLWQGKRPFSNVPMVENPVSGYVVNANNAPFTASGDGDNVDRADYPPHFGIDNYSTNRGLRINMLYGSDQEITEDEFIGYKFDHFYSDQSRVMELVRQLVKDGAGGDTELQEAINVLATWDGDVSTDNRSAALAILTAQKARGFLLDDLNAETPDYTEALRDVAKGLDAGFGRIDPRWGDVVRLQRGDVDIALNGGPDTLRAVYALGDPADGALEAIAGDTYILYSDWAPNGDQELRTIHQFGAATLNEASEHYDDQAEIFAREGWKTPPMELDELLAEATADYRPGYRPE